MLRGKRPDERGGARTRKLAKRCAAFAAGAALVISATVPILRVEAQSYHMSYIYFGTADTIVQEVKKTNGVLDMVSPSFFDVDTDGSLMLSPMFAEDIVRRLHAAGVKVVPFLSNHWDRARGERALDNRADLADELLRVIEEYDLDGVNVDIENVTEAYREHYTDFVRILRERLPADKEVSVAVAANPDGWREGWLGSYDYRALAETADYLMLMAYDQSFQTGPEGPVAGLPWVERSIQYALNQQVPPEKLVLGLPFYGRYWLQGSTDPAHRGMGVSIKKINEMIERYRGKVTFDETAASPRAVFTIKQGDSPTQVSGRTLPAGTYHVYFENNESLRRKVELVRRYGLRGTGSWSLGQEDESLWNEFGAWLENDPSGDPGNPAAPAPQPGSPAAVLPFRDIPADHWARDDIASVYKQGWMKGRSAAAFAPEATLTRAEAAAILVRMLGLSIGGENASPPFRDVPASHWAFEAAAAAYAHGLIEGTGGGKFSPDVPITREQMAVILQRAVTRRPPSADKAAAAAAGTAPRFTDVAADRWSYAAVLQAAEWGVLRGYGSGQFRPDRPVTRAEAAAMLLRVSALLQGSPAADELIRYGMSGGAVAELQTKLAALGYFEHEVTGYFGEITRDAVLRFQQDHGLAVDGIVGPETWDALRKFPAEPS
jgi:spore germination protein YaaH